MKKRNNYQNFDNEKHLVTIYITYKFIKACSERERQRERGDLWHISVCVTDEHTEGGGYRGSTDDELAEGVHLPVQRLRERDRSLFFSRFLISKYVNLLLICICALCQFYEHKV